MKKTILLLTFALIFGFAANFSANAQIVDATKKTYKTGKQKTKSGVRKTNRGLHKGWYIGKRTGQKTWRKGKGLSKKVYYKTKRQVKKVN